MPVGAVGGWHRGGQGAVLSSPRPLTPEVRVELAWGMWAGRTGSPSSVPLVVWGQRPHLLTPVPSKGHWAWRGCCRRGFKLRCGPWTRFQQMEGGWEEHSSKSRGSEGGSVSGHPLSLP